MDLVMATSRGKGLAPLLRNDSLKIPIIVEPHGGAFIEDLTNMAVDIIDRSHFKPKDIHVYYIAGLPDITVKEKGPHYQEVIFNESPEEATSRVSGIIANAEQAIKDMGAVPCFSTIAPMSLRSWNNFCLDNHRTSHLLHFRHYPDMQDLLIEATIAINQYIFSVNISNNMMTPRLGETILHKQNSHKKHRIRYGRLDKDGVHLIDQTKYMWADIFLESSIKNRIAHH